MGGTIDHRIGVQDSSSCETIAKLTSFRRKPESRGAWAARRSLQGVPDPGLNPLQFPLGIKGEGFATVSLPARKFEIKICVV